MNVSRFRIVMLAACLLAGPVAARADGLREKIDAVLSGKSAPAGHVGVRVIEVDTGKVLYSARAEELFVPASNMKLLTTAAALGRLGPNFTFRTTFALQGEDLVVLASGDPGLGDPRLAARAKEPIDAVFVRVAKAIKATGRERIAGDLVVDATVFDGELFHPNWPADQRSEWYAAEVAGLNFNDNCIDIRLSPPKEAGQPVQVELIPDTGYVTVSNKAVHDPAKHLVWFRRVGNTNQVVAGGRVKERMWSAESVTIHDPSAYTARVLADVLRREGVELAGAIRFRRVRKADGGEPEDLVVLHRHEQLIGPCLWRCNTHSQNFFAEALLKSLGAYRDGSPRPTGQGSWAAGRAAVLEFLRDAKLPLPDGLVIDDGSGLSKANQISPMLLTELLRHMAAHPSKEMWMDSLATGGVDGTLRRRFRGLNNGDGEGVVLAKTGTLSNASALSGYVRSADDRLLAFSILADRLKGGVWQARQAADKIVKLLVDLDETPAPRN